MNNTEIKQAFREARQFVIDHMEASRERTKALDKLYEAEMWAEQANTIPVPARVL